MPSHRRGYGKHSHVQPSNPNISEHTAKFHVNSILGKLDAATRTEAVMRGIRTGLLKV